MTARAGAFSMTLVPYQILFIPLNPLCLPSNSREVVALFSVLYTLFFCDELSLYSLDSDRAISAEAEANVVIEDTG